MESQEKREWAKRLIEIKKKQNEQLNLHQSALIEREKDIEEYGARRIEAIRAKKTEGKNRLIAKIQRSKIKKLRKIMKAKKQMEQDPLKRDIVEEYMQTLLGKV
jgi:phage tail tape-measure protein